MYWWLSPWPSRSSVSPVRTASGPGLESSASGRGVTGRASARCSRALAPDGLSCLFIRYHGVPSPPICYGALLRRRPAPKLLPRTKCVCVCPLHQTKHMYIKGGTLCNSHQIVKRLPYTLQTFYLIDFDTVTTLPFLTGTMSPSRGSRRLSQVCWTLNLEKNEGK